MRIKFIYPLRLLPFLFFSSLMAVTSAEDARADEPTTGKELQRLVALVDYVAADYPGAVSGGRVLAATEFEEQRGLLRDARALATRLPDGGEGKAAARQDVLAAVDRLIQAVEGKRSPEAVAALCRDIRARLVNDFGLALVPASPPSLERATTLYRTACARCHGEDGRADTPEASKLTPRPVSFLDGERMSRIAPSLAFHALTFGVKDTAMASFDTLPASDRWSLAFYVVALRHPPSEVAVGEKSFRAAGAPLVATTSRLAELSDGELDAALTAQLPAPVQRAAAITYLRRGASFAADPGGPFAAARRLLDELAQLPPTDTARAHDLAVAAYLDGLEPHEAALRARDPELTTRIERDFLDLRRAIDEHQGESEVARRVAAIRLALDRAEERQSGGASRGVVFLASLTIALREGLESALLIAALLAFLRKSKRPDAERATRLVHLGWMTAIPAGLLTWWLAGALLAGARRELVEAIVSLAAALMILGVTHWVLGRMEAQHWVGFLRRKVTGMTDETRAWPLYGLAFFAAYREAAEVVLFYQALLLDADKQRWVVAAGALAGVAGIVVVLLVLQKVGRRLNPRPVMLGSSVVLALLAIALVGRGVRALQEGGYLALTPVDFVDLGTVGIYPSREGLMAQAALILLLALPSLVQRMRRTATVT